VQQKREVREVGAQQGSLNKWGGDNSSGVATTPGTERAGPEGIEGQDKGRTRSRGKGAGKIGFCC
jgi:hypothetical protein